MNFRKALTICKGKAKENMAGDATALAMFMAAPSLMYAQLTALHSKA